MFLAGPARFFTYWVAAPACPGQTSGLSPASPHPLIPAGSGGPSRRNEPGWTPALFFGVRGLCDGVDSPCGRASTWQETKVPWPHSILFPAGQKPGGCPGSGGSVREPRTHLTGGHVWPGPSPWLLWGAGPLSGQPALRQGSGCLRGGLSRAGIRNGKSGGIQRRQARGVAGRWGERQAPWGVPGGRGLCSDPCGFCSGARALTPRSDPRLLQSRPPVSELRWDAALPTAPRTQPGHRASRSSQPAPSTLPRPAPLTGCPAPSFRGQIPAQAGEMEFTCDGRNEFKVHSPVAFSAVTVRHS
ncbi:uncharacterized protein LOC106988276 [Acinonyx jubatus]|uniref:Uncharacterized protein LOC106988276 n=1 Tax=Acinonyx jubatus TaxID=32536 RepID=A0ABM3NLT4_ACIJB|nr:uncharacterized protein LOC106988276 [Acinonyx jubatus]